MLKSIKTLLWAALVASLSLGFVSCSSDSDDDGLGGIKVKRLPVKITEHRVKYSKNGTTESTLTWTLTYDTANRITSVDNRSIEYDAEGRVIKAGDSDYKYNSIEGYVGNYTSSEGFFGRSFYIDDQGFLKSYNLKDGESSVELYDNNRNHIKHNYIDQIREESWTVNFNNFYSPFASAEISRWIFLDDRLYLFPSFAAYAVGQNMPSDVKCRTKGSSIGVSFDSTFEVVKSEDNYPIEILEIFTKISSIDKVESIYTIEYKDAN